MKVVAFLATHAGFVGPKIQARNQGLAEQHVPHFDQCLWVHCASLGEFEQGKVLVDALRAQFPKKKIVLTFFSSSGYEKRKNYGMVDSVLYLPYDTPESMEELIGQINPQLVVFIKYEFWFTLLDSLSKRDIPFVFVSAVFRPSQYLFFPLFSSLKQRILKAEHIFVQNNESLDLLRSHGYDSVTVAGDTRIDRVLEIRKQTFEWAALDDWVRGHTVVIGGSTWPKDESFISLVISQYPGWKWILAPHDISPGHMDQIRTVFGDSLLFYTELEESRPMADDVHILIIDQIGLLSSLYRYGHIAYIGGGHGAGIHNTLEPAVYGLPLIFGPRYTKFQEAVDFTLNDTARVIRSKSELATALDHFSQPSVQDKVARLHRAYFDHRSGAVDQIMNTITEIIAL